MVSRRMTAFLAGPPAQPVDGTHRREALEEAGHTPDALVARDLERGQEGILEIIGRITVTGEQPVRGLPHARPHVLSQLPASHVLASNTPVRCSVRWLGRASGCRKRDNRRPCSDHYICRRRRCLYYAAPAAWRHEREDVTARGKKWHFLGSVFLFLLAYPFGVWQNVPIDGRTLMRVRSGEGGRWRLLNEESTRERGTTGSL